jgi:hypothetical protein
MQYAALNSESSDVTHVTVAGTRCTFNLKAQTFQPAYVYYNLLADNLNLDLSVTGCGEAL